MSYTVLLCQGLLATIFGIAVVGKTRSRQAYLSFAESVRDAAWLPRPLRRVIPPGVVVLEATATVLLAIPATTAYGLGLSAVILGVFAAAIAWSTRRGERLACHCFGVPSGPMGAAEAFRNLLLATAASGALLAALAGRGPTNPVAALVSVLAGALVALVITRWDDLRFLFTPVPGPRKD